MAQPWIQLGWKVTGSLRPLFVTLDDPQKVRFLTELGARVKNDVSMAARAKPWRKLGHQIANKTAYQVHGATSVEVGSTHEVAGIRETGGPISAPGKRPGATGASMLTIPVADVAKGKSVGDLRKRGWVIFRVPRGGEAKYLFGYRGRTAKGKRRATTLLYVLRKIVYHPADPWFPKADAIFRSVQSQLSEHLRGAR